ncbi:MAG: Flp pilus assembly complex ATPase component TadA [Gammaproteobacteria bacterium]|nr:Flp pilus assembly complex ATPase component TadA [Gammaproteobacteria bacterium]
MVSRATPRHPGHVLSVADTLRLLAAQGALSDGQVAQVQKSLNPDDERHPFVQLADLGLRTGGRAPEPLTLEAVTRRVAQASELPYFRIDPLKIDVEAVTSLVSQAYATRFGFLPVQVGEEEVTVAVCDPLNDEWVPELSRVLRRRILRVLCNPRDLQRYQREFFGVSRSISGATNRNSGEARSMINNFEQLTELGSVGEPDANDRHIVHLVDWLLQYAFEQRASDIHIEPRREQSNIRFRIDGVLHLIHQLPTGVIGAITSRIKTLGRMDVADKRRPQDGRIRTKTPDGQEIELRLSTMPTTFGEKLVLRIFDPEKLAQPFEALGFSDDDMTAWNAIVGQPHGIILVTGPTGSGKTTTLYSALKRLARPEINVCTIEDPIETVEPSFNQMQVQPILDIDFASGVRTLLRQDPDIIMVGEIRDRETADVAIQAALTGHLVLSTLHTNDAPSAVTRLIDIGVQPFLIGATLLGVVAQRLLRTLCTHCRQPGAVPAAAWHSLVAPLDRPLPAGTMQATGCDECRHTGFRGRRGIYEIMRMNETLSSLIGPGLDLASLRRAALANGMHPLRQAGADRVASGLTTVEEVLSVVPPPER